MQPMNVQKAIRKTTENALNQWNLKAIELRVRHAATTNTVTIKIGLPHKPGIDVKACLQQLMERMRLAQSEAGRAIWPTIVIEPWWVDDVRATFDRVVVHGVEATK